MLEKAGINTVKKIMKKIYLLFAAALFSFNLLAQKSNIVVFSEDGESFYAFLNGVKQNATAQSNVKITDVPGQGANLRLVFANSSDQPIKQDLYFVDAGQEHTIKVKRDKKGALKMKYFGAVPLSESTSSAPVVAYTPTDATATSTGTTNTNTNTNTNTSTNTGTTTNTTTNPVVTETYNTNTQVKDPGMNGTVTTTTTTTNTQTTGNAGGGENINMNVGVGTNGFNMNVSVSGSGTGENINMNTGMNTNGTENVNMNTGVSTNGSENVNMNVNMSGMGDPHTTTTTSTTSTTYSSSSSSSGSGNYTGTTNVDNSAYNTTSTTGTATTANGCTFAADGVSFGKMKKTIESANYSDTKMSTAKTATKNNCLSTEQVKEIMGLFNMDEDKLEYAKFAYNYTVDKNNFYQLGEAFNYSGTKEELNDFINSK